MEHSNCATDGERFKQTYIQTGVLGGHSMQKWVIIVRVASLLVLHWETREECSICFCLVHQLPHPLSVAYMYLIILYPFM